MKNQESAWTGRWLSRPGARVSDGSEFTLEEMFSGKMKSQKPVEERLHPVVYFKKVFPLSQEI